MPDKPTKKIPERKAYEQSISSSYDFTAVEPKIYGEWMQSGYFNPDNLPGKRTKKYVVTIAPPNVTGVLHMGHVLENTISDILVRFHRMRGYKTLWLPGTDHAAIAVNNMVEKELKKEGTSRHELGRDKFVERVWQWREKYGALILDQLKRMGYSLDWSRLKFTMDTEYQDAVREVFKHYHEAGLIYQGERVISWCIKDQTALSDLELEYAEEVSSLWFLKYPINEDGGKDAAGDAEKNAAVKNGAGNQENNSQQKFITVATTRPETMLGDTAIAVNPKDPRYKNLIGKTVLLPIVNREIPIIADPFVDMEFGTGAVKVTPAHDFADSEIAERANLPYIKVINEVGKIIIDDPEFSGLKIAEARAKVVEKFQALGLLEKEESIKHNVAKCYRCNSTVEVLLSKQWFLKMKPLAEKAIAAIKNREVVYHDEKWAAVAVTWLENIRDWCVSRQIWWGHQIPIEGSADTFDTWFSSALWPFATLGWPKKTKDMEEFYPTSMITSGRDIIHLWIARMIFSGIEFTGEVPFKDIIIHATVLTKDGKRMSKSLGTGIDPLGLADKYGADATRFGLMYQALGGQDIHFNEDVLMMGKKFCNKIWNIARYVLGRSGPQTNAENAKLHERISEYGIPTRMRHEKAQESLNKAILQGLAELEASVTEKIQSYNFGQAAHELYDFIWHEFADKYVEASKNSESEETKQTLEHCMITFLKLLHPYMPFITEELWKYFENNSLLMVASWPE